jgi:CubicO group peptidase (beta-lactamase class C family)
MDTLDPITAALRGAVDDGTFPGAVLAVRHQGVLVFQRAVGRLSVVPPAGPATVETVYDLASLTKPLATATAVLLLVQQGRLTLESRVGDWLEPFEKAALGVVSLTHLLSHSAGLPGWRPFHERLGADGLTCERCADRGEVKAAVMTYIREETLLYPPGSRSLYSDLGFMLLGFIVERVTGDSLAEFCDKQVFRPLGAAPLAYHPTDIPTADTVREQAHPVAPTEDDPWRRRMLCGEVHDENAYALGGVAGHAGLFGTAHAVLAVSSGWAAAYRDGETVLDPALVRHFASRQRTIPESSWGLGWDTPSTPSSGGRYLSESSFGHLGYTGTSLWIDPVQELEIVLLSNRVHPTRQNERIRRFRPYIHDVVCREILQRT